MTRALKAISGEIPYQITQQILKLKICGKEIKIKVEKRENCLENVFLSPYLLERTEQHRCHDNGDYP